jgi:hypothetical protein
VSFESHHMCQTLKLTHPIIRLSGIVNSIQRLTITITLQIALL